MVTERKSRRRRRKEVLMKNDGSLFDATERRRITPAELRDYVRDGGLFEARRQETGADCTYEVLQSVIGVGVLQNSAPGLGGGPLSPLGGLSGLAQLGGLATGSGGLAELARTFTDDNDTGCDDWDEPRRRSPPRSSEGGGWAEDEWTEKPRS